MLDLMITSRQEPPTEVRQLAEQRAAARRERDFGTADRLKGQIEQAGWKVVDAGAQYRLEPAHPPNVEIDGVVRYGSSAGAPSRLHEPEQGPLTVVSVEAIPPDTSGPAQWIAVLDEQPAELTLGYERLLTHGRLGLAAAWNIGLRRAVGSVVVLLAPGVTVDPRALADLAPALDDVSVGVVGLAGLTSVDLRRWRPAKAGDVEALDAELLCFHRRDAVRRGPLDERFATPRLLAVWWSLVLRDEGQDRPSRRALALDLELDRRGEGADGQARGERREAYDSKEAEDRQARRDLYRLIDRFGRRLDLLREPLRPTAASAKARRQPR